MDELPAIEFLQHHDWHTFSQVKTDQQQGLPPPPLEKPAPAGAARISLPPPEACGFEPVTLHTAIQDRRSRRKYAPTPLELAELAYLLWCTQGVHHIFKAGVATRRTVPSAGARHPFETYLVVNRVRELTPGLYRYLALSHELVRLESPPDLVERTHHALLDQYVSGSAITFLWSAIPYRTAWRYGNRAPRLIALDIGHVCQNLYLACAAVDAGCCAIGAYNQAACDALLSLDGSSELVVYCATVGKRDRPGD